ncbi:MAG TPA: hypothetical protein VHN36_13180 [Ilumatobacteraceae bacterium]|nr:hypothetical protein [Ilumatobacteraceae bacterium]
MIDHALGDDPKAALIAARQLKDEVEWLTERSVSVARREGYDWGQISRLLGISRQWARERFKNAPPRMPPHVVERNRYLAEQREGERLLKRLDSKAARRSRSSDDGDDDDLVAW